MANITTTELAQAIPTVVAAEALGYLQANTVLAQVVARDWDDAVANYGQVVKIPVRAALSANDKAANAAVTLQNPADTAVSVTLNKHKEVSFLIEDIAAAMSRPDHLSGYISDAMKVIAEQIDGDIAALYSGFSASVNATTGLTAAYIREARRLLNVAKAPLADRWAVINEDAEKEAFGIAEIVNRDYRGDVASTAVMEGFIGRFAGFNIVMDQKIATAASQVKNLFMQRNAIVLVTRALPPAPQGAGVYQTVMHENGVGLRVTVSYSPNYLGVQCTIDTLYGCAILRNNHGVVVLTTDV